MYKKKSPFLTSTNLNYLCLRYHLIWCFYNFFFIRPHILLRTILYIIHIYNIYTRQFHRHAQYFIITYLHFLLFATNLRTLFFTFFSSISRRFILRRSPSPVWGHDFLASNSEPQRLRAILSWTFQSQLNYINSILLYNLQMTIRKIKYPTLQFTMTEPKHRFDFIYSRIHQKIQPYSNSNFTRPFLLSLQKNKDNFNLISNIVFYSDSMSSWLDRSRSLVFQYRYIWLHLRTKLVDC